MNKIKNSYKKSGVNISLANKLVKHISSLTNKNVKKTNNSIEKEVIGGFGSIFDISKIKIKDPVIVSSTDGVGTKIELANKFKKFDTVGIDLVAMCVNDLIVLGAKPLFFLDYISIDKKILKGIFKGCSISKCKLIGGETAEMPGVYSKNKFDLAGFSVGIVSKKKILSKNRVKKDNVILAIPSNGLHSNGFSLVRSLLKKSLSKNIKKELLKPTKIYTNEILKLSNKNLINAAAHITGGGLIENLTRSIPKNLTLNIDLSKIKTLKIFKWIKKHNITDKEMIRTFNCGVGFCVIAPKKNINKIKKIFSKKFIPYEIGFVSKSKNSVNLFNEIEW